jgi:hypothetical protein
MLKSILTFLFPKTIASIKKDSINEYLCNHEDPEFDQMQADYYEMMSIEHQQWLERDENI